eukprot:GHRQ01022662.1.p1 GENE.GHRQ01022662.1~~GHRQ01022662.1.p1  ORF type:complete len:156 (-),score=47.62 GHRQ01022662.1:998-1465(-)
MQSGISDVGDVFRIPALTQVQPTGLVPLQKPVFPQQAEKPVLAEPVKAAGGDAPAEGKKILGYDAFTWQKIIPLGAMFFCILFNYTILRDTKVRWAAGSTTAATSLEPFIIHHCNSFVSIQGAGRLNNRRAACSGNAFHLITNSAIARACRTCWW